MKLPEIKIEVDGSDNFTEQTFSVGNGGIIFDILRNKLYSDAVQSICREYSSNARDAHREIGTFNRPIEIHFPNAFDGNFKVKDFGIGISKNRMSDVFVKYGNSTKRNDNVQLGGYGIGCKSAWSKTDTFSIITTANESGVNTTCTYIAYMDESRSGKIRLVSEKITTEPTGTEIIIPVQDEDIQAFIDGTLKSTQYWNVKPLFFGINPLPEYPSVVGDLIAESGNWKIYNKKGYNSNANGYNGFNSPKAECLAIIDGIQYRINDNFIDFDDRWILSCNVHMYFDIGQLTLSASRETLQYDDNTKKLINERIKLVQKELSEQIIELLNEKETYVEAVEFYNFMNLYFHKALNKRNLTWRGHKIIGSEVQISKIVLENTKVKILSYSERQKNGRKSIRQNDNGKLIIDKHTEIYYNDINPEHVYRNKNLKALQSHKYIQIINYIKGKTYDDFVADIKQEHLNRFKTSTTIQNSCYYQEVDNSFIFDIIEPKLLSSVIEDKTPPKQKVIKPKPVDKITGYRLINSSGWKLRDHFQSYILEADTEGCYLDVVFNKDQCSTKYKNDVWNFCANDLPNVKKLLDNVQIFSVKEKDLPKLTKIKPLSEAIFEKFNKLITSDYYKSMAMNQILKTYGTTYYNNFSSLEELKELSGHKSKIKDKNSLLIKYFDYTKHLELDISLSFINKIEHLLNQSNNIDVHVTNAKILIDEMKSRYPLLNHLYSSTKIQDILNYINLCDELYNQKQSNQIAIGA